MAETNIKQQARELVESLPDNATWEDLMYTIYVREAIDAGIRDADDGRLVDVADIRAEYGLPS